MRMQSALRREAGHLTTRRKPARTALGQLPSLSFHRKAGVCAAEDSERRRSN
jgi:hypothetical protein